MLDVVGVGFGRTGTLSLKLALERLGFGPCHHMSVLVEDPGQVARWARIARDGTGDWDAVYGGYRATTDWPGARYWRQITAHFPQAKVILTVRDPQRWYESALNSIYHVAAAPMPADPAIVGIRRFVRDLVWNGEFAGRFADRAHAIGVFTEHNEAVRREIPAERLLEFEVDQGWAPLCGFLEVPVPDEPFPRSNDQKEFAERLAQRLGP